MKLLKTILLPLFALTTPMAMAQFAPQAGIAGSTAISKSSKEIVGWANACEVVRGYINIADPSQGRVTAGDEAQAIGPANSTIISLGDSGVAVLSFASAIYNGPGADIVVFENGFIDPANPEAAFLELAYVEVSSDGQHFVRFPASSHTPETPQVPMAGVYLDARHLNNLAGKYAAGHGTPFDLEELAGSPGLDLDNITHVRVVDVVGSTGAHASRDKEGNKINDPYPTPLPGGGFDLDAVGARYLRGVDVAAKPAEQPLQVYPNPVTDRLFLRRTSQENLRLVITDVTGAVLARHELGGNDQSIAFRGYEAGIYYLHISNNKGQTWVQRVTKL